MQNVVEGAIGCMLQDQKGSMDQILKQHTHQGNYVLVAALTIERSAIAVKKAL